MYGKQVHLDDESLDLGRYISGHEDDPIALNEPQSMHRKNLHSEELNMQVNRINARLESICVERVGDLSGAGAKEIERTLQL